MCPSARKTNHGAARQRVLQAIVVMSIATLGFGLTGHGSASARSATTTVAGADGADPATGVGDDVLREGAQVFTQFCASCHQAGGVGLAGKYPPLKGNPNVDDAAYVEQVIRNGRQGELVVDGTTFNGQMPAQTALSDTDIVNVIAYIQSGFQAPAAAPAASSGPVAGTQLPGFVGMATLVAFVLAIGVGLIVLAPRLVGAHDGRSMPWLDASLKTGIIVVGLILFTTVIPSRVLETETVAKLSRPLQDTIAGGLWVGGLGAGLWALWYAHRDRRI